MTRTIEFELNKFPSTPAILVDPITNAPLDMLSVGVKKLFHHYFLAKYGDDAEDTGVYEYERGLTAGPDWRFRGAGIGADNELRSDRLGRVRRCPQLSPTRSHALSNPSLPSCPSLVNNPG